MPNELAEIRMFGCTETQMDEAVKSRMEWYNYSGRRYAQSLISDAQEEMTFDIERARQSLNRAKWILENYNS